MLEQRSWTAWRCWLLPSHDQPVATQTCGLPRMPQQVTPDMRFGSLPLTLLQPLLLKRRSSLLMILLMQFPLWGTIWLFQEQSWETAFWENITPAAPRHHSSEASQVTTVGVKCLSPLTTHQKAASNTYCSAHHATATGGPDLLHPFSLWHVACRQRKRSIPIWYSKREHVRIFLTPNWFSSWSLLTVF